MSEELKTPEVVEVVEDTKEAMIPAAPAAVPSLAPMSQGSMLSSPEAFASAMRMAKTLSTAKILPDRFVNEPGNCLILLDMAQRSNMSFLFVAQNLYVVQGNPAWSGQACIALINNCGRFTSVKFKESYTDPEHWSCQAYATEKATGEVVYGTEINYEMARSAGWYDKNGTYWKKMPMQMAKYRAAAFFARAFCPEALFGLYTDDEQRDIHGAEEKPEKTTVTFKKEEKA